MRLIWNAPSNHVTFARAGVLASAITSGRPLTANTTSKRFSTAPAWNAFMIQAASCRMMSATQLGA